MDNCSTPKNNNIYCVSSSCTVSGICRGVVVFYVLGSGDTTTVKFNGDIELV